MFSVTVDKDKWEIALIELLSDDNGISHKSYEYLLDADMVPDHIRNCVDATDGRFYLPEGWSDEAK